MRAFAAFARAILFLPVVAGGCSSGEGKRSDGSKTIAVDGSSTVFPINEAVAEEFQKTHSARVTIGVSGTGGGFQKFCRGELAITGASRPIVESEMASCAAQGIGFIELPVAYDGIAIVTHRDSTWMDPITVAELKKIWEPTAQAKVMKWNQVRASWPAKDLLLFGPGVDSGTYDYFTKAVIGVEHASRGDFTSSEDDNVLVQGVSTAPGALGVFGYAYYAENTDKLHLVAVDAGSGPVRPSSETVADGTYTPLSRPVFVYVSTSAAGRPEVDAFVRYYLTEGIGFVSEVGYVRLSSEAYRLALHRFQDRVQGTMFGGGSTIGVVVEKVLAGT